METRKTPLQPDNLYHIYNRGINGQNIFIEERNYAYFLIKYAQYVQPYVDTFAYCLLRNHFHFLIRTKSETEIRTALANKHKLKNTPWIISNAFSSLFKSYAQAINKHHDRTGALFEEPFHRIQVQDDSYFSSLIAYIHQNPQKHGFIKDFRDYPYSSYSSYISDKPTKLKVAVVMEWFGGLKGYVDFHNQQQSITENTYRSHHLK